MILEAFAKINWTLMITGIRSDGYHLLDMLMQPVSLCDRLTILPDDGLSLTVSGTGQVTSDETNLVMRAARCLKSRTGTRLGAAIVLEKNIPVQAGMGGGSSDAAAALKGLNRFWNTGLDDDELESLGVSLGADVPFFIRGGLARSRGIGEKLERVPCDWFYPLLVLQPESGLNTGAVFRAYHEHASARNPFNDTALQSILSGGLSRSSAAFANVLEPASRNLCPEIGSMIDSLSGCGAALSMMTGSGSAVFGVFASNEARDAAFRNLSSLYRNIWRCSTQNESMRIVEEP